MGEEPVQMNGAFPVFATEVHVFGNEHYGVRPGYGSFVADRHGGAAFF